MGKLHEDIHALVLNGFILCVAVVTTGKYTNL